MTKKFINEDPFIIKNSNWKILTKNLVIFKRLDEVNDEKF